MFNCDDAAVTDAGERHQKRLGEYVKQRRLALRLTMPTAAKAAEMARGTWDSLEKGKHVTRPHQYAAIEEVLQWETGSIDSILGGGKPTPLDEGPVRATTPAEPSLDQLEDAIRAIAANPNRSQPLKEWAETLLVQVERLREADQREAREQGEQVA